MAGILDDIVADPDQVAPQVRLVDGDGTVCRLRKADDAVGKLAEIILDGPVRSVVRAAEETFRVTGLASCPRSIMRIMVAKMRPWSGS